MWDTIADFLWCVCMRTHTKNSEWVCKLFPSWSVVEDNSYLGCVHLLAETLFWYVYVQVKYKKNSTLEIRWCLIEGIVAKLMDSVIVLSMQWLMTNVDTIITNILFDVHKH